MLCMCALSRMLCMYSHPSPVPGIRAWGSLRASQHTYSLPRIDPYMCKATNGVHSLLASTEFSYGRYPYSVKLTNSVQHPVFASKMEALHCNCMQAVLVRWCGHQRRRLAAKAGARRHRPTQVENPQEVMGLGVRASFRSQWFRARFGWPGSAGLVRAR